jgi:hypothetical protein
MRKLVGIMLVSAFLSTGAWGAGLSALVEKATGGGKPPRATIVLVDQSASIDPEDRKLYRDAFQRFLATLTPGDRVVLAAVADRPVSRFQIVIDRTCEKVNQALLDEQALKKARAELSDAFEQLLKPAKQTPATHLLDSLTAIEPIAANAGAARLQILLLSDGVEESFGKAGINFAKRRPNPTWTKQIVADRKSAGLMPKLAGAEVNVIGAGGKTSEDYSAIREFWRAYFTEAGARLVEYGRVVPAFK